MHLAIFREEIRKEMMERLKSQGIEVLPEMVKLVMFRGSNGLEFLTNARNGTSMFHNWFQIIKDQQIDVGAVRKSPYDVVLKGFNFEYVEMSCAHARYRGFLPDNIQSDVEKAALNAFWASAVEVLNSHHPSGVAA
jgi:hypothetical protein